MLGPDNRYTFKNLEPVNYLKTFNRMIDHQRHNSDHSHSPKKPKLVPLSRFPIPKNYQKMEGVFENVAKKKMDEQVNRNQKEIDQQEQFMKKHHTFMRQVLNQFIEHNEDRQRTLEKQKQFYRLRSNSKQPLRSSSTPRLKAQPKTHRAKELLRFLSVPEHKEVSEVKATVGSTGKTEQESQQQEDYVDVLPKLEPIVNKKLKGKVKKEKQIEQYVVQHRLSAPNPEQPATVQEDSEDRLFLTDEIVNLQNRQASKQLDFAKRIEEEINDFGRRASMQIHAIKYANFWKQPEYEFMRVRKEGSKEKEQQNSQSRLGISETAESPIRFRQKQYISS